MYLTLARLISKAYREVNYALRQLAIQIIELLLTFSEACKLALS